MVKRVHEDSPSTQRNTSRNGNYAPRPPLHRAPLSNTNKAAGMTLLRATKNSEYCRNRHVMAERRRLDKKMGSTMGNPLHPKMACPWGLGNRNGNVLWIGKKSAESGYGTFFANF
jgi:hypothetical protein